MNGQNRTIFGIDLGTTYSCIAYVDEYGRPVILINDEGWRTTPSVVLFEGENRIVGREAKNNAVAYPDQVVELVKRHMGEEGWRFHYDGLDYSPEEISSYILRKLAIDAEMQLGTPVTDVVIACPVYFDINQREATKKAGQIAGFHVLEVLNEPTAAAIMYGVQQEHDQVVLVYDLGGATFDVSILEIKDNTIRIIATGGDHILGGRNWDESVVLYLADCWMEETGSSEDPLDSRETQQDLLRKAEEVKWTLTSRQEATVMVVHEGQRVRVKLSREKFDELTAPYLERTIQFTKDTMHEAEKRGFSHIDQIMLVGGSSRMPQVKARLELEFSTPLKLIDPDEAVAKGAAIYAHNLLIDEQIKYELAQSPGTLYSPASGEMREALNRTPLKHALEETSRDTSSFRPNFFLLLDLNPNERWDQVHFETVLKQKQREWVKESLGIGPKALAANRNIALISMIREVMNDPTEREKEAEEAKKQLADQKKARQEKFEEQIEKAQSKGYLEEKELQHYINEFKDILLEPEIRKYLHVPVRPASKRAKKDQLDPSLVTQIAQRLDQLHVKDLYALLGKPPTHSRAELYWLANDLYTEMVKRPREPETALKMELAGYALKVFGSDAARAQYDATLEQAKITVLLKDLEEIVGRTANKEVHEKQVERFLEAAGWEGWSRVDALEELKAYASTRKWILIAPAQSSAPQQKCGYCSFMNDIPRQYCRRCGRELYLDCPNCGKPAEADAISCGQCGFPVGDRFEVDDLLAACRQRIAQESIMEAEKVLKQLELIWKPYNVDKRLVAIRECRVKLEELKATQERVIQEQNKQLDRNPNTVQFHGAVQGVVIGEHNTVKMIFQDGKERTVPFLAPSHPPYQLIGRDNLLHALKQRLLAGENVVLSALHGLPGVGKTALAIALAYDREVLGHFSDGILWAGLGREAEKLAILDKWGAAVGIAKSEMEKFPNLVARKQAIHNAIGMRRMLLVIDDAWLYEDADTFRLGGPNCAHIVTTRLSEVASDFAVEGAKVVHELAEDDGLALLRQFIPDITRTTVDEARELVRMVGSLPLALILMGKYLRKQAGQPRRLRDALGRLRQMEERLKLSQPQAGLERHPSLAEEVPLSLLTVIKVSDEALDAEARYALRALSVFPSKPNSFSEEAALAVAKVSTGTIDTLADSGLLENASAGRYSLHQTICDYAQCDLRDAAVYERMVEYFIEYIENHKTDYRLLEQETSNILVAVELLFEREMFSLVKGVKAFSSFIHMLRRTKV
jgi:molecular chaperone DnaK